MNTADTGVDSREILSFSAKGRLYGVWLDDVAEIIRVPSSSIVSVPMAPPELLGLMSLAGKVMAVFNGAQYFTPENPDRSDAETLTVLVFSEDGENVGLAVDQLGRVYTEEQGQIEPGEVGVDQAVSAVFQRGKIVFDILNLPVLTSSKAGEA